MNRRVIYLESVSVLSVFFREHQIQYGIPYLEQDTNLCTSRPGFNRNNQMMEAKFSINEVMASSNKPEFDEDADKGTDKKESRNRIGRRDDDNLVLVTIRQFLSHEGRKNGVRN